MPFTFSHPAIVLPLKKVSGKTLSLTGLVIGSITPDFEYFIRMKVRSIYSHSVPGIFWFDLPLALLLTFIYHNVVRNALINNLPKMLNRKLNGFKNFDWIDYFKKNWGIVIVSILIGAASHLFWDAFTHPFGYFVTKSHFLNKKIIVKSLRIPMYEIFQQLSSLIGGIIVILAILSLKNSQPDPPKNKIRYWLITSIIMATILLIRFATGLTFRQYGDLIVTIISAFLIGLIISSLMAKPEIDQPIYNGKTT